MEEPCALWVLLLRKFSIGKLPALEVQEVASAAVKSGADNAEMRALQGLGGMGHARGNVHRDLVRKYFSLLLSQEPWEIQCPLAVKQGGHRIEKEASTHMLLPHLWVIEAQENNFLGNLCCKDEEIAAFWRSQMKSPQMTPELKQVIKTSQPSQLPVPYLLHGDAAPFTEVDSIQVLSFRPGFAMAWVLACFVSKFLCVGLDSPFFLPWAGQPLLPCPCQVPALQQSSDPKPDAHLCPAKAGHDQGDLQEDDGSFGLVLASAMGWSGAQKG
jgi:hypothetical protein